ncbi:MAG: DoxX family membrane protein [Planctomycetota bacterium]
MRHALAIHFAPLLLRVALGLTFVWAGAGKLSQQMPVTPANQATLASWGLLGAATQPSTPAPKPEPGPETETEQPPKVTSPESPPADTPADPPSEADGIETPPTDSATDPDAPEVSFVAYQLDAPKTVRAVYGIALLIDASANPTPTDANPSPMPLWPPALAADKLPVYFAWAAAVTELIAGVAVLFGFFTRLGALPIAGTMAVAMWLTEVGPAIQTGNNTLGFLPPDMFVRSNGIFEYTVFLWQLALLAAAGALACIGPGFLSIDRLLFGPAETHSRPTRSSPDDDDVTLVPMSSGEEA